MFLPVHAGASGRDARVRRYAGHFAKDQAGTAVFILARIGNTWQLEDVPHALFNVK